MSQLRLLSFWQTIRWIVGPPCPIAPSKPPDCPHASGNMGKKSFYGSEYPTGTSQKVGFLLCDIVDSRPIPTQFRLQRGLFLQRAALSIYPYSDQFHWWIDDGADHAQRKDFVKERRVNINYSTF
jgi:hypothetical protein